MADDKNITKSELEKMSIEELKSLDKELSDLESMSIKELKVLNDELTVRELLSLKNNPVTETNLQAKAGQFKFSNREVYSPGNEYWDLYKGKYHLHGKSFICVGSDHNMEGFENELNPIKHRLYPNTFNERDIDSDPMLPEENPISLFYIFPGYNLRSFKYLPPSSEDENWQIPISDVLNPLGYKITCKAAEIFNDENNSSLTCDEYREDIINISNLGPNYSWLYASLISEGVSAVILPNGEWGGSGDYIKPESAYWIEIQTNVYETLQLSENFHLPLQIDIANINSDNNPEVSDEYGEWVRVSNDFLVGAEGNTMIPYSGRNTPIEFYGGPIKSELSDSFYYNNDGSYYLNFRFLLFELVDKVRQNIPFNIQGCCIPYPDVPGNGEVVSECISQNFCQERSDCPNLTDVCMLGVFLERASSTSPTIAIDKWITTDGGGEDGGDINLINNLGIWVGFNTLTGLEDIRIWSRPDDDEFGCLDPYSPDYNPNASQHDPTLCNYYDEGYFVGGESVYTGDEINQEGIFYINGVPNSNLNRIKGGDTNFDDLIDINDVISMVNTILDDNINPDIVTCECQPCPETIINCPEYYIPPYQSLDECDCPDVDLGNNGGGCCGCDNVFLGDSRNDGCCTTDSVIEYLGRAFENNSLSWTQACEDVFAIIDPYCVIPSEVDVCPESCYDGYMSEGDCIGWGVGDGTTQNCPPNDESNSCYVGYVYLPENNGYFYYANVTCDDSEPCDNIQEYCQDMVFDSGDCTLPMVEENDNVDYYTEAECISNYADIIAPDDFSFLYSFYSGLQDSYIDQNNVSFTDLDEWLSTQSGNWHTHLDNTFTSFVVNFYLGNQDFLYLFNGQTYSNLDSWLLDIYGPDGDDSIPDKLSQVLDIYGRSDIPDISIGGGFSLTNQTPREMIYYPVDDSFHGLTQTEFFERLSNSFSGGFTQFDRLDSFFNGKRFSASFINGTWLSAQDDFGEIEKGIGFILQTANEGTLHWTL